MNDFFDVPAGYSDADLEMARLEELGRVATAAKRHGICTHGHVVGWISEPVYPEQAGLCPGEMRCVTCHVVFPDPEAWLSAMREATNA